MYLPMPSGMALEDWETAFSFVLGEYIVVPTSPSEDWQHWGLLYFQNPQLSPLNPPNPYEFTNWILWAEQMVAAFADADGVLNSLKNQAGSGPYSYFLVTNLQQPIVTNQGANLAAN